MLTIILYNEVLRSNLTVYIKVYLLIKHRMSPPLVISLGNNPLKCESHNQVLSSKQQVIRNLHMRVTVYFRLPEEVAVSCSLASE
jgi:hypothetical protein